MSSALRSCYSYSTFLTMLYEVEILFVAVCDFDTMRDSVVCTMWDNVEESAPFRGADWEERSGETRCHSQNQRRKKRSPLGNLFDDINCAIVG